MMKVKDRKLTEKECINSGGHFWKYWDSTQGINEDTFEKNGYIFDVYYPNGAPKYRGCPLCGRIESMIPAQWIECIKGKEDEENKEDTENKGK